MKKRRKSKFNLYRSKLEIPSKIKRDIFVLILLGVTFFSLFALFGFGGKAGIFIDRVWQLLFGWGWWAWSIILLLASYFVLRQNKLNTKGLRWVGIILFVISCFGLLHVFVKFDHNFIDYLDSAKASMGGGMFGYAVSWPLLQLGDFTGALIILIILFLVSILFLSEKSLQEIFSFFKKINPRNWFNKKKDDANNTIYPSTFTENIALNEKKENAQNFVFSTKKIDAKNHDYEDQTQKEAFNSAEEFNTKSKKTRPHIDLPLSLLNNNTTNPTSGDTKANQEIIKHTFEQFGIDVEMGEISIGPTVTQYTFKPASGVKVAQVISLHNDLALALAAHPIRIEAPIPGKSLVGIEVPNQKIARVSLREVLSSPGFYKRSSNLMISLGKDVSGTPWLADLAKMPHLLIAGATNSGKTVCMNSIIISLLYQNQPDDLKLILVDPKRVEMHQYNGIPHLITPVITDAKKTINALKWSVREMDRRLQILHNAKKRNTDDYNKTNPKDKMPYLVIIIDELADLMSLAGPEVEVAIIRLAQMSRAVGIHLILATQKPIAKVITSLIKSNITARIAFSVASLMDSRTILDASGAEKLLGRGDMLFITAEMSKPKRIQGAFLSDEEIEKVVDYLKKTGEPEYDECVVERQTINMNSMTTEDSPPEDQEDLYLEAKELVIKSRQASTSFLQRKFSIGYSRAAKLIDLLEQAGIVGPQNGSKPREVIGKTEELEADRMLAEAKKEKLSAGGDEDFMEEDEEHEDEVFEEEEEKELN